MFGIALAIAAGSHLSFMLYNFFSGRCQASMLPTRKDASDAVIMLRYCLGLSPEQPRFDRFDYRQKFEYWGLIFGGLIMIITGFILYFPTLTTLVLPGQVVPAAKVAHSQEALLAFLVVIIWHMYGAHFHPGIFPFDASIFTGKIICERILKEHPLEYACLTGIELDDLERSGEADMVLEESER
jgi:cytochrome b subunit of formate dehydrogenase